MFNFTVPFKSGIPASDQVVYAVKKAVASGQLQPGDTFPSVRAISQEFRINPNTAHKAVAILTSEGFLEVHPGVGTVIAKNPKATEEQRKELLGTTVEQLVVEARRFSIDLPELLDAVREQWNELTKKKK